MFNSKRFIAFAASLLTFIILLLATNVNAIELATGLTMLTAIYIAGNTIRPSAKSEL